MDYTNIIVTIASLIITNLFLSSSVGALKTQVESQQGILDSLKIFKDIYNPKDFEDLLKLKLDKQKELFEKEVNKKIQQIIETNFNENRQLFNLKTNGLTESQNELSFIISSMLIGIFPTYASKPERDIYIQQNFPKSKDFIIELIDLHQTQVSLENQS